MYEWAKPGVKVVCVNDIDTFGLLTNGVQYTISSMFISEGSFCGLFSPENIVVKLEGFLDSYEFKHGRELVEFQGFNIKRFRPLITKRLPDTLTILLEKPDRVILPDGERWDHTKPEKVK